MTIYGVFRVCFTICLVLAAGLLAFGVHAVRSAEKLHSVGRDARATVTYRAVYQGTEGAEYDIRYIFQAVPPGKAGYYGQLVEVKPAVFDMLKEGDPIQIRYDPDDPDSSTIDCDAMRAEAMVRAFVGAGLAVALLAALAVVRKLELRSEPPPRPFRRQAPAW